MIKSKNNKTYDRKIPLLQEQMNFDYEFEKGKGGGPMIVKGILQKSETLNQNKRVYPHDVLEREVNNYQKFIRERRSYGELDHPDSSVVELKNTSHLIVETWWKGKDLYGKIELLNTPSGKILQALFEAKCTVGISSRGVGSTVHQNGMDIVQDDFMLICWDFVSEPSTPGAFMFKEGREISESVVSKFFRRTDLLYREANRLQDVYESLKRGE